jgi:hypothetical protein
MSFAISLAIGICLGWPLAFLTFMRRNRKRVCRGREDD